VYKRALVRYTIDPTNGGFEFVVGAGKRVLTLRDAQHEYIYNEAE